MKKFLKSFLSLIILVSASLIFFACNEKPEIKLQTPYRLGIVNDGELNDTSQEYTSTQFLLVTNENPKASGYRFYITDNSDFNNRDNYVSIDSLTNYLDVTNIFDKQKEYHYFVQYLGKGSYLNSDCSSIEEYIPEKVKVDRPYLQLVNEKLYWVRIMNANSYEIYETVLDKNNEIVTPKTLVTTVNSETFEYDLSNRFSNANAPYHKYQYEVKAIADGFYLSSDASNNCEYIKEIILEKPSGINIAKNLNTYNLAWNAVPYATSYEIVIDNDYENKLIVDSNNLNITNCLIGNADGSGYRKYTFKVKAITSEALNYNESEYSEELEYDFTYKLNAPENLTLNRVGELINITFDEVDLAETYVLIIKINGEQKYISNPALISNNISLNIEQTLGEITENTMIEVIVYANNVGEYIFQSDKTTVNYEIIKTN